jgi:hypothetical protein
MDIALIVLGAILLVIIYYFLISGGSNVLSKKLDLTTQQPAIEVKNISEPTSRKYSYEMWIYVYNFEGIEKYIISRSSTDPTANNYKNIGLSLDGASPTLRLRYTSSTTGSSPTNTSKSVVLTDNFPLQTWVHLIVSVDDKYIDTYLNGKLIKSIQDSTIETPSATSSIEFGTLNCYLAKLARTTNATDPQTAWDKYTAGNGENPFSKVLSSFGLTMTLQKNNQDYSKITLF